MHHKPKNRGAYVDNQKCIFCEVIKMCIGLHHCVLLVEMVKKTYMEHPIWGPDERVMSPRKYLFGLPVLPVRTSSLRPVGATMNYRYFRSETRTSGGWRRKAQFCAKMNYWYFRSEIGTSGGDRYYRWSLTRSTGRCLFRI
jgi:hypothetical protein